MGEPAPQHYRVLASSSRIDLLHALHTHGPQNVEQLAETCGLHPNTAREHLHRLIDAGFVRAETIRRPRRGRPQIRYSAAESLADPAVARRVRDAYTRADLVRRVTQTPCAPDGPTPADRQLDVIEDQLDACGFDATMTDAGDTSSRVTVHHCPYYELAGENPHVCAVHFRMLRTALRLSDGPLEATELHARDPKTGCWITLSTREGAADPR